MSAGRDERRGSSLRTPRDGGAGRTWVRARRRRPGARQVRGQGKPPRSSGSLEGKGLLLTGTPSRPSVLGLHAVPRLPWGAGVSRKRFSGFSATRQRSKWQPKGHLVRLNPGPGPGASSRLCERGRDASVSFPATRGQRSPSRGVAGGLGAERSTPGAWKPSVTPSRLSLLPVNLFEC